MPVKALTLPISESPCLSDAALPSLPEIISDEETLDITTLNYTNDPIEKSDIFDYHAFMETNFFVRFKGKYGDVENIDLELQIIQVRFLDGKLQSIELANPSLYVEREEDILKHRKK